MKMFALRCGFVPLALAFLFAPETASACSVCLGDPSSKAAGAMNGAIFLLMGFIGSVLTGLGGFVYSLKKRADTVAAEENFYVE